VAIFCLHEYCVLYVKSAARSRVLLIIINRKKSFIEKNAIPAHEVLFLRKQDGNSTATQKKDNVTNAVTKANTQNNLMYFILTVI